MGRGRVGQAQSADCVVPVWHGCSGEGSERRCLADEAALDGGSGGFHGAPAGVGRTVRKLVGRKKRSFRPPVPMLGDDGKPLASLQAKANQHQRVLMKEFGENCAEFSEAEHLVRVQADKQAAPVLFTRSPTDTCALRMGCSSRFLQAQVRSCVWARRCSLGVDCSRRPGISPGARRLVCQGVEGRCSDVVEGRRYGGRSS